MRDVITGLVKSVVFGLVITGAWDARRAFPPEPVSEEVGRSTTSAVVTSIFLVVFVDLVFTAIFYVTGGV
jgi:phospholipid/cholesterol/gamma-HCH transport system permease protein